MTSLLEYQRALDKKPPKILNLVHGEEEFLIKNLVDKLRELYKAKVLWGEELTLRDFKNLALTGGVFESGETFFVYNAQEFFKTIKDHKQFASILTKIRGKRFFFHVGVKLSEKDLQKEPFLTFSQYGEVISASKMDRRRVEGIVRNKLQKSGVSLEEGAFQYLLEATSYDLMLLKGETDKLLLYGEPSLTLEELKSIVFAHREMSLFDLAEGILLGDYGKALEALSANLQMGVHPLQILGLLSNYLLKLYTAKVLTKGGKKPEEALALVEVKHPFQVANFKKYLEKNSQEKLRFLLDRLYLLDLAIKVYYSDPTTALKRFVVELMLHEAGARQQADARDQGGAHPEP
ncbi:MAG: DNA polymerase III subunit delta [Aquificaceae bacterium]|nr:DNA polymerase III subunit delta [Aquificaceae bacterium]MCX8060576.1 DNA polymerase III subunit delta [Aquificaceae bacterium]MDW8097513.1 DNA polymerase III subunit delta [Aquificaceae bacterium]